MEFSRFSYISALAFSCDLWSSYSQSSRISWPLPPPLTTPELSYSNSWPTFIHLVTIAPGSA